MNKRHTQILELLTKRKKIEVSKLSQILGVSQVTIRKDLAILENSGVLLREHGYATLNDSDDINNRLAYHYDSKQKIAKLAVETIENGETVMIESGSCCALVALEIAHTKKDVTIITNSAFIADYIRKMGTVKIILLGGEYQNESQVMVGPIMKKCAETFFVDKLFIGTDGFSEKSGLRHIVDSLFDSIGKKPTIAYEIEEDQVIAGLVSNNFGIAIVPYMPILKFMDVKTIEIVSPTWERNFYLGILKDKALTPIAENFKSFVTENYILE